MLNRKLQFITQVLYLKTRMMHCLQRVIVLSVCCLGLSLSGLFSVASADTNHMPYIERPAVQTFIEELVTEHGFDKTALTTLFAQAKRQQNVLDAIAKPAERKLTWSGYRPIFMQEDRITQGVEFWNQYRQWLTRAELTYGVPPEMIVAIIGVETKYGKFKGKHPVLDSLITLGFDRERRSAFFRSELAAFLLLTRNEKRDPTTIKGSYAGAMGMPQFISSSYQAYAVDFDNSGVRDLWESPADAIGSVANYFAEHGWQQDQPVVSQAVLAEPLEQALPATVRELAVGRGRKGLKPNTTVNALAELGLTTQPRLPASSKATLLAMELDNGDFEYWIGLPNFYVITRYNHSSMYALAAYQLSQAIKARYEAQTELAVQ